MASADGWFYMFDVNTQEGGICKLLTQASIYTSNPAIFPNNNLGNANNLVNNNSVNNTTNHQNNFNNPNIDEQPHANNQQQTSYEKNQSLDS